MKAILSTVFAVSFAVLANGQFQAPDPNSPNTQIPTEEVRTGSTVEYSLDNGSHVAGEEYRWEVTGGTITAAPGGSISGGGTIVEFAADAHTITVDWDQAPAAIDSLIAQIQVQKISGSSCPSQIQILPINVWNLATAAITTASESLCSGDSPVANIPVALTGAPDGTADGFAVDYSFTVPSGLSALDGGGVAVATSGTVTTNGSSVNIPLPATLINTTSGDLDFEVTLTRMNDVFTGNGAVSGTYTITVNPVPVTGEIESSASLTRR